MLIHTETFQSIEFTVISYNIPIPVRMTFKKITKRLINLQFKHKSFIYLDIFLNIAQLNKLYYLDENIPFTISGIVKYFMPDQHSMIIILDHVYTKFLHFNQYSRYEFQDIIDIVKPKVVVINDKYKTLINPQLKFIYSSYIKHLILNNTITINSWLINCKFELVNLQYLHLINVVISTFDLGAFNHCQNLNQIDIHHSTIDTLFLCVINPIFKKLSLWIDQARISKISDCCCGWVFPKTNSYIHIKGQRPINYNILLWKCSLLNSLKH